ncbi:hypothetical protein X975_02723, partial [Stegodyphus mimosarum]
MNSGKSGKKYYAKPTKSNGSTQGKKDQPQKKKSGDVQGKCNQSQKKKQPQPTVSGEFRCENFTHTGKPESNLSYHGKHGGKKQSNSSNEKEIYNKEMHYRSSPGLLFQRDGKLDQDRHHSLLSFSTGFQSSNQNSQQFPSAHFHGAHHQKTQNLVKSISPLKHNVNEKQKMTHPSHSGNYSKFHGIHNSMPAQVRVFHGNYEYGSSQPTNPQKNSHPIKQNISSHQNFKPPSVRNISSSITVSNVRNGLPCFRGNTKPSHYNSQILSSVRAEKHINDFRMSSNLNKFTSVSNTVTSKQFPLKNPVFKFKSSKVVKPENKAKQTHKKKKRVKKVNFWKDTKNSNIGVTPLLSFQRISENSSLDWTSVKSKESDDDDDNASISHKSSDGSNVSDIETDGTSSDESEFSIVSSVKDSEIGSCKSDFMPLNASQTEKFVIVCWDIENCSLPSTKSAVDFVKHVRNKFYDGRTETQFIVACDVSNLNDALVKDLDEASVTIIHKSSRSKNAADQKLMIILMDFQNTHRRSDSAVVLISGDSDFASYLSDMRYKHHIYVNLICKKNAKTSLISAADRVVFFEDFIKDVAERSREEDTQFFINVSNLPKQMNKKQIKKYLTEKITGIKGRVKILNESLAIICFPDLCAREKAVSRLSSCILGDCKLQITCSEGILEGNKLGAVNKNDNKIKLPDSKRKSSEKVNSSLDDNSGKGGTLYVYVSERFGDVEYWKNELGKLWNISDLALNWDGNSEEGFFMVNFKSLSKAQKAKKKLLKKQMKDPMAPKFLKLVKHDELGFNTFCVNALDNMQDLNKKKINDYICMVEKKKDYFLNKHQEEVSKLKKSPIPQVPGAKEVLSEKLNEMNEQKVTFLNFTSEIINKLNKADICSENLEHCLDDILREYSRECNCFSSALPIYAKKNTILKKIKKHQVTIIRAETGSGKSTQLTQYVWGEQILSKHGVIMCTQPRKIAAISLAKYVSSQVGCSLGDIVGYEVGMSTKKSNKTAILYVTDFTMLKMVINNEIENASCIIVDEAHERTVYTDLLLGMLKSYLKAKPSLKLVITSATIDTSIFRDYFNVTDDAVLHVSGRIYPVEDIWCNEDVSLGWDFFQKTVDTVHDILNTEKEPGDILAFLTTPAETEKAVDALNKKVKDENYNHKIKILQLHGKLDVQEQQKIFERIPVGMRKVVFSTNCAETSVTIPGIRYVVDCGMVKESQYDSVRNMSILCVGFVSRSSAEQRRGRAGRTQVGKCFRLYSKKNYDNMAEGNVPEILRVNLGQALLKLMQMGVKNPVQFDFVQSPSEESLKLAMKQLTHLGAVNETDLSLTALGRQMSYLPVEPRLSFLVLKGVDSNIGFEAVSLASLITVSRSIFFRNSENKNEADKKKMRFCQNESDFLTYLDVYKEWFSVPKVSKSKWCVLNCINAQSMRTVHNLVNELILILTKEINLKIPAKFNDDLHHEELLKIIFYSFSENICVFSGHVRYGYRSTKIPGELMIHPSSSLSTFGNWRPQFLVYDTILKTNMTYLINISPITKDMILEAIKLHVLKINLEALESLHLRNLCISPIGKTVLLREIIGKNGVHRKFLENKLKVLVGSDSVILDVDISKGEVKIFAPEPKFEIIESVICPIIEKAKETLAIEEKEFCLLENSELTGIVSTGAEIKDVVIPGEFRDLKVTVNNNDSIQTIVEKLQICGTISTVREWKNYFKITFQSPVHAKQALNMFRNEQSFSLQSIIKTAVSDNRRCMYRVVVSYMRRPCTGEAFVSFESDAFLPLISNSVCNRSITYRNMPIRCSISKKSQDLRFSGLPCDTNREEFETLVKSLMPDDIKLTKCIIVRKKVYESSQDELEIVKQGLISKFGAFTPKDKLHIDLKKPSPKDFTWNAFIFFENMYDGENAVNMLKNRICYSYPGFKMKPCLQTTLFCKTEIFSAVKEQIDDALKYFKDTSDSDKTLDITAVPKDSSTVKIQITSNNVSDATDARRAIQNILYGDQIKCAGNPVLERLFLEDSLAYIRKISKDKLNCFVDANKYRKVISIFGNASVCNLIKLKVNSFLSAIAENSVREISLLPKHGRVGVIKELFKRYGSNLENLVETSGVSGIDVNLYKHKLTVKGTESSVFKCLELVEEVVKELGNSDDDDGDDDEVCALCYDKILNEFYRLEYCGHAYCKTCILHLFENSSDFPLSCVGCKAPTVLADLYWATKQVQQLEKIVLKKSLDFFIKNRDDIGYCPSPDCPMIYRVAKDGKTLFECPVCSNVICTNCGDLYHYGMSCSLYQCSKHDDDYSLKVWMLADEANRKLCPSCSSPIEKNEGCNHMTCWKCRAHMCWLCLQVFPSAGLVYNHQAICPKRKV